MVCGTDVYFLDKCVEMIYSRLQLDWPPEEITKSTIIIIIMIIIINSKTAFFF